MSQTNGSIMAGQNITITDDNPHEQKTENSVTEMGIEGLDIFNKFTENVDKQTILESVEEDAVQKTDVDVSNDEMTEGSISKCSGL